MRTEHYLFHVLEITAQSKAKVCAQLSIIRFYCGTPWAFHLIILWKRELVFCYR